MNARSATPVDIAIGRKLRQFRISRDLSQAELARELGITFQQVQKYERGTNRIGSGRLYEAAKVLGVPVADFFTGLGDEADHASLATGGNLDTGRVASRLAAIKDDTIRRGAIAEVSALLDRLGA